MTKHDEQKNRTNDMIINTLLSLGDTKPLSKISVSDITKHAKINRGTFYLHYESKEDLVAYLESKLLDGIHQIIDQNIEMTMDRSFFLEGKICPVITLLIEFIFDNQKLFKLLLNSNTSILFRDSVKVLLQDIIKQSLQLSRQIKKEVPDIPDSYAFDIISTTILAISMKWLENTDEITPDKVARLMMSSLFLSPYQMLGFD